MLTQSGVVFGYPSQLLFARNVDQSKWTSNEKLSVLLFESLLFTWQNVKGKKLDKKTFTDDLLLFYRNHKVTSIASVLAIFSVSKAPRK